MTASLRDHLAAIRDECGTLTPALVVDVARVPEHPLHHHFEWDDTIAGEKWRLVQAGQLLRVTFRPDPKRAVDLRAFVAVKGENSHRSEYVPTEEVAADEFATDLLLRSMKRDWQTYKKRYEHMAEFVTFMQLQLKEGAA